ncbi:MAG TPA: hypothetical protein VFS28_04170, partial [Gemmatimonadales bacterium]|nr:hypothetical protein [Gemmatimonadales bacterium]
IAMGGSMRIDVSAPQILGAYTVANTILGGAGQTVPNLTYGNGNIQVVGTALLGGALDLGSGNLTVDGSAGAADLDLNGQVAQVQNFATAGNGTLTSTTAGSGLVVRGDATFNGGDETGRLTEGGITLKGFFTQDTATSQASYYSSGNHTTVFADSNFGGSHATLATMYAGQSRFNDVAVYGRGVLFFGAAWVAGDLAILDATVDSVGGGLANVAGALTDPNYAWKVDSTYLLGPNPTLPDSIDGTVVFAGNASLTNLLRVGGEVRIEDTLAVNGYTLLAHGGLTVAGPGVLQMTNPTDEVVVDGLADFAGAVPTALMTAGRLTLNGDLTVGATGAFDAGGTHRTVLGGSGTQTVTFSGGPQGYGFNDLVAYAPTLALGSAVVVHGTLADSLPATPFSVQGNGFALDARRAALQNAQFTDLLPTFGDSSQVDTVDIYHTDPTGRTQLTIRGAGRTTPLDLTQVTFHDIPATGLLLQVTDTAGSGDTLVVRMFGSTPFNGKGLTATSGLADAQWGSLALQSFPATVDSAVAFGFGVVVQEPDGSTRPDVVGSVDLTLAANPNGATLGGTTTATFDGAVANYSGLTLDRPGSGTSFLLQMQGRPVDSLITPALDVVNPAPAGAVIFDAGAGDGLWTSALNWSTDAVPTATDSVFIPAGTAVTFSGADTIGTLVLGSGADLTIASGTLVSTGNVFAGQTIAGAGTLEMAGSGVQLSGTFPSLRITGTATAVGPTTVTGDLFVNGAAAEFIVGGQKVTVNNQLWTQNGGLFTMTSPADTLTIDSGSFGGGDETGHLTDGVLFIKSAFDQLGGDPNAFHMSGNHTTVFPNTGSSAFADISAPGSSQFANLRIENPAGVGLNESGAGWIRVTGDFTLVNGGVATGDTVFVGGNATVTAPGDSLELVRLRVSGDLNVAGGYNVPTTELDGTGQTVAGTTGGYQALNVLGTASLGGAVVARSVTVAVGGSLDVGGHPLTVDSLFTNEGADNLLMDDAADTVIVNTLAQFNGTTPATPMTAGYLEIRGDLAVSPNYDAFVATAGHVTRFAGAPVHLMDFPGEGNATPLGTLVVDSGTVFFNDNSLVTGDLILHNGLLADSTKVAGIVVRGSVLADNGPSTELLLGRLTLQGALDWQGSGAHFAPAITEFAGAGQLIPQLPYTQVVVSGNATLGGDRAWDQGTVDSAGVLTLGGHRLDIASGGLLVTDSARLVMQSPGDTLWVLGTAIFSTDANTAGDYTAGVIRTPHFVQVQGSFGGTSSFVQMGSNRIVPQARDTIEFASAGPGVSGLRSIDFSSAGDSVFVSGLWASDSVRIADPATVVVATDGYPFHAAGALDLVDGTLTAARVTLGGTVSYAAGTYAVDTTVFVAEGQIIPATVPYRDIVVQYGATLGGNLALPGRSVRVENSGRLDLAGHTLDLSGISALGQFQTTGPGVLVMQSPADTLVAGNVEFRGGNTTGLLTAGLIRAANFTQAPDYDARSFSASGSHTVALVNLGPFSEAPFSLTIYGVMDDTTSHFNNVQFLATTGTTLDGNVYAADTAYIDNSLFGTGRSLTAAGPVIIGSAAAVQLDTLRVLDTLVVDPSATYQVTTTVFPAGAAPMPSVPGYSDVIIEGTQTLAAPLTLSGSLYLQGNGVLTPNGQKLQAAGALWVSDNAGLVMAAGDTAEVASAYFAGRASGTDLAGGLLRLGGSLTQYSTTSPASFAPTGMAVEFYGGVTSRSLSFQTP